MAPENSIHISPLNFSGNPCKISSCVLWVRYIQTPLQRSRHAYQQGPAEFWSFLTALLIHYCYQHILASNNSFHLKKYIQDVAARYYLYCDYHSRYKFSSTVKSSLFVGDQCAWVKYDSQYLSDGIVKPTAVCVNNNFNEP